MTTNPPEQDWARLARLLLARRAELGYPGKGRAAFARARGFTHSRTIDDLENQRRTNFEPATLAQIEAAYGWAPGSIDAVLAGGDPQTISSAPASSPEGTVEERVEALIREIQTSDAPEDRKNELVKLIRHAEAERKAQIAAAEARRDAELQIAEDELARYRARRAAAITDGPRSSTGEPPAGLAQSGH